MCKRKTVFRIKGLIRQSDLITVMGFISSASHTIYHATFRDKKEEALLKRGKKTISSQYHKYGHIEIRDHDKEHMKRIYQSLTPYLVRDYTHDFA